MGTGVAVAMLAAFCLTAGSAQAAPATNISEWEEAAKTWRLLVRDLANWNVERPNRRGNETVKFFQPPAEEVVDRQSLVWQTDRDPLDILLRRTRALCDDLKGETDLKTEDDALAELEKSAAAVVPKDEDARRALFLKTMRLRRAIAFKNPLVKSIEKLLFITREAFPTEEFNWGTHICDQFFGFHAKLKRSTHGNGLYVLEQPFSDNPKLVNLLAEKVVEAGPWKGRKLITKPGWDEERDCGFLSPDVSWDGKQIVFSCTKGEPKIREWDDETVFHIFKCNADGSHLVQLTSGNWNDLFPCWLPNGRIAFVSERRGGYGRCHRRPCPTFTLHTMFPEGWDITCVSPHETNEFEPSVDNNGMIVYTRWDYFQRGFNQAHHGWIAYPDGRDPRELNGNTRVMESVGPHATHSIRAIPGSRRYVATAAGHHTLMRGSLVMIDPSVPDDNRTSQVKRITPDQLYPESEANNTVMHHSGAYATAWPLSEKYYICVYDGDANCQYGPIDTQRRKYNITLLDVFGNKVGVFSHPQISCLDPMPLQARTKPPVIPHKTLVGKPLNADGSLPLRIKKEELPTTAEIGLVNVRNSRYPFPENVEIKALRVWQVLPKTEHYVGVPRLGVCDQTPGAQCLGTVPVESDGSAYFRAPVGVPLSFQALDENGCAVQIMRSDTYVAPGEQLTCNGCHENRAGVMRQNHPEKTPIAMKRAPSVIAPEVVGSKPYNYPRLVQPVLDAKCVSCHSSANPKFDAKKMPDLVKGDIDSNPLGFHTSFREFFARDLVQCYTSIYKGPNWYRVGHQRDAFVPAYSEPGKVGARGSRLYEILKKGHHGVELTVDDWRRLILFMDSQGLYIAHDHNAPAQLRGEVVAPALE